MQLPINPRITLSKTAGEWQQINLRLKEMNRLSVKLYIHGEVSKLAERFVECPDSVTFGAGEKTEEQICIPRHTYEILRELSKKMKRPINALVDDFFIAPLLAPKP
jgi:hypothetical protein